MESRAISIFTALKIGDLGRGPTFCKLPILFSYFPLKLELSRRDDTFSG